eukprot:scaffold204860_cov29-Tisochrysis_lutea.AAC.7
MMRGKRPPKARGVQSSHPTYGKAFNHATTQHMWKSVQSSPPNMRTGKMRSLITTRIPICGKAFNRHPSQHANDVEKYQGRDSPMPPHAGVRRRRTTAEAADADARGHTVLTLASGHVSSYVVLAQLRAARGQLSARRCARSSRRFRATCPPCETG